MVQLLTIAGLGPGDPKLVTPNVQEAILSATDIVGYIPYVARIPPRDGLVLHTSDNRVEICLLYTSPSPRDLSTSRMPSSA